MQVTPVVGTMESVLRYVGISLPMWRQYRVTTPCPDINKMFDLDEKTFRGYPKPTKEYHFSNGRYYFVQASAYVYYRSTLKISLLDDHVNISIYVAGQSPERPIYEHNVSYERAYYSICTFKRIAESNTVMHRVTSCHRYNMVFTAHIDVNYEYIFLIKVRPESPEHGQKVRLSEEIHLDERFKFDLLTLNEYLIRLIDCYFNYAKGGVAELSNEELADMLYQRMYNQKSARTHTDETSYYRDHTQHICWTMAERS